MVVENHQRLPEMETYDIKNYGNLYRNLSTAALYEEAVKREEGLLAHLGPIVVKTGHHTGRSPEDKFIVKEESSQSKIWWGGNKLFDPVKFEDLYHRLLAYLQGKDIFIQDCYVGANTHYSIPIRVVTEYAWHNLFARNMFNQIQDESNLRNFIPEFTIISMPRFHASPDIDGTKSDAFVIVNFGKKLILIGGTSYAGEIKKAVFTVLNYLLPENKVLSMHCSANEGFDGDVSLFFGLSGTGKTTLSTDITRKLIGDDEHGWSENGIFNFEGGCYAKVIRISKEQEPQIYDCTRRFGTILENVIIDSKTRLLDLNNSTLTENTRASYPLTHLDNSISSRTGAHPKNIFMLSCDTFGILPPIALLTPEQAAYYFLQGYTAKVAGTEVGLGSEPKTTFSTCFGAPFLALPPRRYSDLLIEKIVRYKVKCWLLNTGWVRGEFGRGERIPINYTRSLVRSAINGDLIKTCMEEDKIFGIQIPGACADVPSEILKPVNVWEDKNDYYNSAKELAMKFIDNFKQFSADVPRNVLEAGPRLK
jgi:phosphoenolpyruvate carboxykinase (ATP)